jgi:hypothetical protein
MNSPVIALLDPIQKHMPNKNKKTIPTRNAKKSKQQSKKSTQEPKGEMSLIAKALRGIGSVGGNLLAGNTGASVGQNLGAQVSKWLGHGDYGVDSNSIVSRVQSGSPAIPAMHSSGQSIVVRHKEYIADIISSATPGAFLCSPGLPINPGLEASFPWLATIAQQFQEYTIKGLVYHFESTSGDSVGSTNTALGTVIMGTQYKSSASPFPSKLAMLNEYFSADGKPSVSFCHPIECDPKENPFNVQYVRGASVPAGEDIKMYDLGTFYWATVGMQAASVVLGELWCTYEVELRKPILSGVNNVYGNYAHFGAVTAITAALPFGTIQSTRYNSMGVTIATNVITLPIGSVGLYKIDYVCYLTTACSGGTSVAVNLSKPAYYANTSGASNIVVANPAFSYAFSEFVFVQDTTKIATWAFTLATLTGATGCEISITQLPYNGL